MKGLRAKVRVRARGISTAAGAFFFACGALPWPQALFLFSLKPLSVAAASFLGGPKAPPLPSAPISYEKTKPGGNREAESMGFDLQYFQENQLHATTPLHQLRVNF